MRRILFALLLMLMAVQSWAQLPTTAGWHELADTNLRSICPADNFGGEMYAFSYYCQAVTEAWSSAVFDASRNRLVVWGGGHNDYAGNEVYTINLDDQTISRLNDPGIPTNFGGSCLVVTLMDGSANSRHTYDGIAYMDNEDRMYVFGGAVTCLAGGTNADTHTLDFSDLSWHDQDPHTGPTPNGDVGIVSAYDPNTGKVFVHDNYNLYSYTYSTNTYVKLTSVDSPIDIHMVAVIDSTLKRFYIMGSGNVYWYDIDTGSSYVQQHPTTTGGDDLVNAIYPGIAFDPNNGYIVGWNGGGFVYKLNTTTHVWTKEIFTGDPGRATSVGTFNRWSYSPDYNGFVVVNSMNRNAFVYKLAADGSGGSYDFSMSNDGDKSVNQGFQVTSAVTATGTSGTPPGTTFFVSGLPTGAVAYFEDPSCVPTCSVNLVISTVLAAAGTSTITVTGIAGAVSHTTTFDLTVDSYTLSPADFTTRCATAGVVRCYGFDTDADFTNCVGGVSGCYGYNFGVLPPSGTSDYTKIVRDTTVKASGASSMKTIIPSYGGSDSSGEWFTNFSDDLSVQFGAKSSFYIQWQQRFSDDFLANDYETHQGWKQADISTGDQAGMPNVIYSSCSATELVQQNVFLRGFPELYNSCTGSVSHGPYNGLIEYIDGGANSLLQNARPDPFCTYNQMYTSWFPPIGNCFGYFANEWMTFQLGFVIGPRVEDEWAGSYIYLWIAREGHASETVIAFGPYNLTAGPSVENQRFGKAWLMAYQTAKDDMIFYPEAYTWYDNLIISTNRIADPDGSAPPSPAGGSGGPLRARIKH